MPTCPACKKEIDELIVHIRETSVYRVWFQDGDEHPQWERIDAFQDGDEEGYECPECGEQLFTTYKEAMEFLKGEKAKTISQ